MKTEKTILITGCSSGIGYDAAHGLKRRGWRVFATCRQQEDCDRLISEGLESYPLDYESQVSINAAVGETLDRTEGTLHAVFNNGAYAIPGLLEDLPTGALRAIFETNFFAQHELTRQLIPVFRAQGHGRVLMNSSVLGFAALPWRGAYNASKFAMEGWADTLRLELADSNIQVVLIEPGPVTSRIRENSIPHYEKWIKPAASHRAAEYKSKLEQRLYRPTTDKPDPFELPARRVTAVVHDALTLRKPKARYRITTPTKVFALLKRVLPTRALDRILQKV